MKTFKSIERPSVHIVFTKKQWETPDIHYSKVCKIFRITEKNRWSWLVISEQHLSSSYVEVVK